VPNIPSDQIWRRDVRDTASEIEPELQPALDQVQADKVAPAVVQLAVVEQDTVVGMGEEPQFNGERLRDAFQAR